MIDKYYPEQKFREYSVGSVSYEYSRQSPRSYHSTIKPDNSQVIKAGSLN